MPFNPNAQYASTVKEYIVSSECDKPRVIYAARKLLATERQQLVATTEPVLYICECVMQDLLPSHSVVTKVYTELMRLSMLCSTSHTWGSG